TRRGAAQVAHGGGGVGEVAVVAALARGVQEARVILALAREREQIEAAREALGVGRVGQGAAHRFAVGDDLRLGQPDIRVAPQASRYRSARAAGASAAAALWSGRLPTSSSSSMPAAGSPPSRRGTGSPARSSSARIGSWGGSGAAPAGRPAGSSGISIRATAVAGADERRWMRANRRSESAPGIHS